jgi:flagellar protein FliO/FliZ
MQELGGWTPTLLTALAALAGVIGALVLVARGARAAGLGMRAGKRMAMQEVLALDGRRRLVLLRCDGRELLLLTGGAQDVVVGWLGEAPPTPVVRP